MNTFTVAGIPSRFASLLAGGTILTAGLLGFAAPAFAAPTPSEAQDTINSLEDQGYTVVVNNPNDVPMSEATVAGVRQGPEHVHSYENIMGIDVEEVTQSIVFVDIR